MVTLFCVYYADNTDPENLVGIVFTQTEAKKICDENMQIVKLQVNDAELRLLLAHGVKCK
jgi:hypothetical protein